MRWGNNNLLGPGAVLCGVLVFGAVPDGPARAGFLDFLFGNQSQQSSSAQSYADPSAPVTPAPLGPQSVRQGNSDTGHGVAYCVRLCDGQHFPLEHMTNATPVETCRAMCPASKTKVFFGSEIGGSVARDGARYADLDSAFLYRKQMVPNCTCNGRNAFGLAPFDLSSDPTLRPGDIVATRQGLMAYSGKNGTTDVFTPVNSAAIEAQLNPAAVRLQYSRKNESQAADSEDDPGTIAISRNTPPPVNVGANPRGQLDR